MIGRTPAAGVQPLPGYDGPTEAYLIDAALPYQQRVGPTQYTVWSSLVIDHRDYDDALELWIDGPDHYGVVHLDLANAKALIEFLRRDVAKLERIIALDPEDAL